MGKLQRRSQSKDDVPVELIQRIQTLLPVKDAVRTCVLSKTWSHAWSTIPHLRFHKTTSFPNKEKERDYFKFMDHTMSKYVQDNIPIESFDLKLNARLVYLAYKWIRIVAARLKVLSIDQIYESNKNCLLPGSIFSGKYLHTLFIKNSSVRSKVVINCVSLNVLELYKVEITEEVLDTLFSTCTLLEIIKVSFCIDLKTIKIRNLKYLQQLKLETSVTFDVLEIDDVPNLCLFSYFVEYEPIKTFNMASLTSVTELSLDYVTIDVAFLDMIISKLPSLEILNLNMIDWTIKRLDITSYSLKRLRLIIWENGRIDIQVYAPKLLYLYYKGYIMHSLIFPSGNAPKDIKLELETCDPVDHCFFLRMREVLNLSSKFVIKITYWIRETSLNINVNDLQIRFLTPSTNVEQLSFYTYSPPYFSGHKTVIDALLSICHPKYVTIHGDKLMISGIMAMLTCDQKMMEVKNPHNEKWQVLKISSWTSFGTYMSYDGGRYSLELKPNW